MLLEWRKELSKFEDEKVDAVCDIFSESKISVTEHGRENIKKWIKEYGISEVIESCEISIRQYLGSGTKEEIEKSFSYIPRICYWRKKQAEDPFFERHYPIKT